MKKLRFSTFAQVLTVLLCAAMIWTGLYVLDSRANVVWDLTPDLLTELSEGTIQTMDGLDESVHLHLVFKAETESDLRWMLETLAGSYVRTGHAVTDTIDPVTEPGKIRGYASISEGSVIVASADESRYVVVPVNDLYAYQMTSSGSYTITGLSAEQKITSAIRTVTGESTKVNKYLENGMNDAYYFFGTDELGRDIWTRTWYGARISLIIAVVATVIDMIIGMSYGLISGYFGGVTDGIMQRAAEIVSGIPRLVVVILLSLAMKPGLGAIIVALLITEWIGMSRIARAEMLRLKDREYILASRTLGAGNVSIIFKGVLPNIVGPVITQVMFSIQTAIFTEAFLSFVGLGVRLPECSLGSLISDGFQVFNTHPYQIVPPIIVLALLMLSFNLVGDGLREALNPKMKDM